MADTTETMEQVMEPDQIEADLQAIGEPPILKIAEQPTEPEGASSVATDESPLEADMAPQTKPPLTDEEVQKIESSERDSLIEEIQEANDQADDLARDWQEKQKLAKEAKDRYEAKVSELRALIRESKNPQQATLPFDKSTPEPSTSTDDQEDSSTEAQPDGTMSLPLMDEQTAALPISVLLQFGATDPDIGSLRVAGVTSIGELSAVLTDSDDWYVAVDGLDETDAARIGEAFAKLMHEKAPQVKQSEEKAPVEDESWRQVSISELGLTGRAAAAFAEAGIDTLGEAQTWLAAKPHRTWKDLAKGIGPAAQEKIDDAFQAFWEKRRSV